MEELQAVGARVHLAEPAETAARRGTKKRAKTDRADARHLRELVMAGRLPESWIPPEHLLELRARVRLRHTLVDERREWQQRMQSVLYHHGVPARSWLLGQASRPGWPSLSSRRPHANRSPQRSSSSTRSRPNSSRSTSSCATTPNISPAAEH